MLHRIVLEKQPIQHFNKAIKYLFDDPQYKGVFINTTVKNFLFDGVMIRCNNPEVNITGVKILMGRICDTAKGLPQLKKQQDNNLLFSLLSHVSFDFLSNNYNAVKCLFNLIKFSIYH